MKGKDFLFGFGLALLLAPFFIFDAVMDFYSSFNAAHGMVMAFIKFALLATLGEVIGLRIKTGDYNRSGFGIIPRAVVWGFLGLGIKLAFIIFATGAPVFLEYLGIESAVSLFKSVDFTSTKLLVAFTVSATMNIIFAPVMMTTHKITDMHITRNGGTLRGLFRPIAFGEIISSLNWDVQWNFVFKKTIPLFWIPAHTATFLLPPQHRILAAALLGVALGILLAIASLKAERVST